MGDPGGPAVRGLARAGDWAIVRAPAARGESLRAGSGIRPWAPAAATRLCPVRVTPTQARRSWPTAYPARAYIMSARLGRRSAGGTLRRRDPRGDRRGRAPPEIRGGSGGGQLPGAVARGRPQSRSQKGTGIAVKVVGDGENIVVAVAVRVRVVAVAASAAEMSVAGC